MKRVKIYSLFVLHFIWVLIDCAVIIIDWLLEKSYNGVHKLSYWTWHINEILSVWVDDALRHKTKEN